MAETEYLKTLRKTKEAAEQNAQSAAQSARFASEAVSAQLQSNADAQVAAERAENLQLRAIAAQQAAAQAQREAQAESLRIQIDAVSEQRAHNFAMWRQTGEGSLYMEWEHSATSVMAKIGERETAWKSVSEEIRAEATLELIELNKTRPKETRAVIPSPPSSNGVGALKAPRRRLAFTSFLVQFSFALSLITWILLGGLTYIANNFGHTYYGIPHRIAEFIYVYGWMTPVIGIILTVIGVVTRPKEEHRAYKKSKIDHAEMIDTLARQHITHAALRERLNGESDSRWGKSLIAGRIKKYGYDPISDSDGTLGNWTTTNLAVLKGKLETFIAAAHSTPPTPGTYPSIEVPQVIDTTTIVSQRHRDVAAAFTD